MMLAPISENKFSILGYWLSSNVIFSTGPKKGIYHFMSFLLFVYVNFYIERNINS